jgi:formylglycine-generating enzyme required for sulfatase activity
VDSLPANKKGFFDVFGNAWEWTKDFFSALPGFEVHRFYEDFSTPCFDGLHHVIQGGSFISTGFTEYNFF